MVRKILEKYFSDLPKNKLEKLHSLYPLYLEWNNKINLISRKEFNEENFYIRHLVHSLSVIKFVSFPQGITVMDVGTGGGFPGIPLAIIFDKVNFTLLDSRNKKLTAVKDIAQRLELNNVTTMWDRVENVKTKYDFITGRAVKDLSLFYAWTKKNLKNPDSKIIYLGGGETDTAFIAKTKEYKEYSLKIFFEDEFFETKKVIVFR